MGNPATQGRPRAGLTALNYLSLAAADWLAFHAAGVDLPAKKIGVASLLSYAASFNFGALLGGATMRYRLYSAWGLAAAEILTVVSYLAIATWMGLLAVASIAFLTTQAAITSGAAIGPRALHAVGVVMALVVVSYLAATLLRRKPLQLRGFHLLLPSFPIAAVQLAVSALDLLTAAGALWVLLPDELAVPFPVLLSGFMLAVFATIVSHAPGGIGVFELIVLSYVVPDKSPAAVGALVLFRLIYYLTPLAVATVGYLLFEWRNSAGPLRQAATGATRVVTPLVPPLLALLVFLCGVVLLVSGALPGEPVRLIGLAEWLPLHITEMSHLVGSIVGALLLVIAHGLSRRYDSAWVASVVLVVVGIAASLAKGFDWEEAAALTVVLALLAISRPKFYRRARCCTRPCPPAGGWPSS